MRPKKKICFGINFCARIRFSSGGKKSLADILFDFFCSEARLVVEVDGGQHFEDSGRISDVERTEYLEQMRGFQVLRFTNLEIKYQFTEVCSVIDRKVQQNVPSSVSLRSTASPKGEASVSGQNKTPHP